MLIMITLFNSSSQKQSYGLQTIQDYKLHKTTMDKFEHKIKRKRYSQEQINFYLSEIK